MFKKRFLKYFSIFLVVVALFICFIVPSSAASINDISKYKVTRIYNSYGDFPFSTSIFTLHDPFTEDSYICDFLNYEYYSDVCYNAYHLYVDFPTSFSIGQVITVSGSFCVSSSISSLTLNLGSFSGYQLFSSSCQKMYNEVSNSFYYYVPFSITFKVTSLSINSLDRVFFTLQGSGACSGFGINSLNFDIEYDMSSIVNGAASDIKANQDKNTDKILNGGHDSPSYSSPDTDIADKFASAEGNVMSDAQSQWDKIDDKFLSVITTVRTSKFYRGMLVVTKILEEFTGITWLGDIILVAFCLGAFSFVIGMSSLIIFRNSDNIKLAQEKSRAQRSFERDMM